MSHLTLYILEGSKLFVVLGFYRLEIVLKGLLWVDEQLCDVMVSHLESFFLSLHAV
jgi:hypothetical protein